jgi:UDP-glucose 4-epimerase
MKIAQTECRVLVTGGAGFIGSHLVDYLAKSGCHVTVLDNFRNGRRENLEQAERTGRVRVVNGDVTDPAACDETIQGVQAVFHLACLMWSAFSTCRRAKSMVPRSPFR